MAVVITENVESRPFNLSANSVRELVYDITGTADEVEVQTKLALVIPPVYGGLTLEGIDVKPVQVDSVSGEGIWRAVARYTKIDGDNEYTFDTGGGTTKVTQSLATIASYSATILPAPDFEGAIGVTEDSVEGVEITTPVYNFTETHRFADAAVTAGYKADLFRLTGTTNIAAFKGFQAGEVLFLGAAGSKRGDERWSITFRFAASPNVTGLVVGPITGVDKGGWQYLWVRYADFEDALGISIVKRPISCYVEQVYREDDFSLLNIGI